MVQKIIDHLEIQLEELNFLAGENVVLELIQI